MPVIVFLMKLKFKNVVFILLEKIKLPQIVTFHRNVHLKQLKLIELHSIQSKDLLRDIDPIFI